MTDYSSQEYLDKLDAYWRAANYVSVGQLYLKDNPLLRRPLKAEDVKVKPICHECILLIISLFFFNN